MICVSLVFITCIDMFALQYFHLTNHNFAVLVTKPVVFIYIEKASMTCHVTSMGSSWHGIGACLRFSFTQAVESSLKRL